MFTIKAADVNEALWLGVTHLLDNGVEEQSRNGPVLVAPGPVCIEYTNPLQRVLYSPTRDANAVFHFMESLWMLAGDNDIEFPSFFNSTYGQFSDDGSTMWDAYGWRWRTFFGWDQLALIAHELVANPASRRCVLSMWNGYAQTNFKHPLRLPEEHGFCEDFGVAVNGGKAVPCNTHAYFAAKSGRLNMTVVNRSNDAIWGCFGANAVHFSFLLEYMAMRTGLAVGSYYQFTNNLHVYTDKFSREKLHLVATESAALRYRAVSPTYTIEPGFDEDLSKFMAWARAVIRAYKTDSNILLDVPSLKTPLMHAVAVPMFLFWTYRKLGDAHSADVCLNGIDSPDWHKACSEWAERRKK